MNVTVRCGFAGAVLFVLLLPDMDDISGVVSVELDAIVIRGLRIQRCRDKRANRSVRYTRGYHRPTVAIMALPEGGVEK